MSWSTALHHAAEQFDGGVRSFLPAAEAAIVDEYGYEPPNEDYEKLFCRATVARQRCSDSRPHSAGWLVPGDNVDSVCKPVFVAHSLLSAIWLLRETLPEDALSNNGWGGLVRAAQSLAKGAVDEPPSAQPLPVSSAHMSTSTLSNDLPTTRLAQRKRGAPLTAVSAKRARTESVTPTAVASPAQSPAAVDSPEPSPKPVEYVATVTNNNRRAERERAKKRDAAGRKNRLALGLVEPDAKASFAERAAYASISQQDEPVIAWLLKQQVSEHADFYHTAQQPYVKACELLAKAQVLGNLASRLHAAQFLQTWRERGSPFGGQVATQHDAASLSLVPSSDRTAIANDAFCQAWDRCNRYVGVLAAVNIEYRWAEALLGKAYNDKILEIEASDAALSSNRSRNRNGRGMVRTEAIASLLKLINANPTHKDREIFRRRLTIATRWYTLAVGLGWGSLLLMPHDKIPSSWVEHTSRAWGLDMWILLVQKVCPEVCAASRALETWLGPEGIMGGPIGEKEALGIESDGPTASAAIEEVLDSEDEDDNGVVEQWQMRNSPANSPADAPLRQMSLLELFYPAS